MNKLVLYQDDFQDIILRETSYIHFFFKVIFPLAKETPEEFKSFLGYVIHSDLDKVTEKYLELMVFTQSKYRIWKQLKSYCEIVFFFSLIKDEYYRLFKDFLALLDLNYTMYYEILDEASNLFIKNCEENNVFCNVSTR